MLSIIRSGDDKLTPIGTIYVPRSPVGLIRSILWAPDLSPPGNSPSGLIFSTQLQLAGSPFVRPLRQAAVDHGDAHDRVAVSVG